MNGLYGSVRRAVRSTFLISCACLLFACQEAPPTTPAANGPQQSTPAASRTGAVGPAGGELLAGGASVLFSPGFFGAPAPVTLAVSGTSADPTLRLVVPAQALGRGPGASLRLVLPAAWRGPAAVAEVTVERPDGTRASWDPAGEIGLSAPAPSRVPASLTLNPAELIGDSTLRGEVSVTVTVRTPSAAGRVAPQTLTSGFAFQDVLAGLNLPIAFGFAAGGRIFVAEKAGVVRLSVNGTLQPTPFIDISRQVNNTNDRGLLDIAVHPAFPEQPYVYLLFTYDPPEVLTQTGYAGPDGQGARVARLVRVTADAARGYNVALPGSEVVLLGTNSTYANIGNPAARNGTPSCERSGVFIQDCLPADELSHTIGTVRFAPDGALLVGNGDGSDYTSAKPYATRAVKFDSLAGKIVRINPANGQGYSTNPFATSDLASNRSKVYDLGLRNPFRFTLRPGTSNPYIGDVGWRTWEEVNVGRGANFGWPCYEGGSGTSLVQNDYSGLADCQALYAAGGVTPSAYAYTHDGSGSSVQVGDFYTGTAYPRTYQNALFVSDFNMGWIRYLTFDSVGRVAGVGDFGTNEGGIVQVRSGPDTNLYFLNIYSGKLVRLVYTARGNTAPVASASATPTSGSVPLTVQFSSAGSTDADGDTLTYRWTFGDGAESTAANPSHTYTTSGSFGAVLTVTDPAGASGTARVTVAVGQSTPVVTITAPAPGMRYSVGDVIQYAGSATDGQDGTLGASNLNWSLTMHHEEHVHPPEGLGTGSTGSFTTSDHGDNVWMDLCLTATNSVGRSATGCVDLRPNTVPYTLTSSPTGLALTWGGLTGTTPFTVNAIVNSVRRVTAPDQGGLSFSRWSDGLARGHDVRVGTAPVTLTAFYTPPAGCPAGRQEAETGLVSGGFTAYSDPDASLGRYLAAPKNLKVTGGLNETYRVMYCVNVVQGGTYRVQARVLAPSPSSNAFYLKVDGAPTAGYLWTPPTSKQYRLSTVNDALRGGEVRVTLAPGPHWLSVYVNEPATRLDTIELIP